MRTGAGCPKKPSTAPSANSGLKMISELLIAVGVGGHYLSSLVAFLPQIQVMGHLLTNGYECIRLASVLRRSIRLTPIACSLNPDTTVPKLGITMVMGNYSPVSDNHLGSETSARRMFAYPISGPGVRVNAVIGFWAVVVGPLLYDDYHSEVWRSARPDQIKSTNSLRDETVSMYSCAGFNSNVVRKSLICRTLAVIRNPYCMSCND